MNNSCGRTHPKARTQKQERTPFPQLRIAATTTLIRNFLNPVANEGILFPAFFKLGVPLPDDEVRS
jgi:hypothetical protein